MRSSRGAPSSRAARRTRRSRSRRATRSPDPRRTRTRARLHMRIAWEGTVRKSVSGPSPRDEERTSRRSDGPGRDFGNIGQHPRGAAIDARVPSASLAETPDARVEATVAIRGEIVSSRVRTCGENGDAPSARAFPRSPLSARTRIRLAPEQRQNLRGAGRRGHGDRAHARPAVPSIRSTLERAPRDSRRGFASPARAVLCPARVSRRGDTFARGLQNRRVGWENADFAHFSRVRF